MNKTTPVVEDQIADLPPSSSRANNQTGINGHTAGEAVRSQDTEKPFSAITPTAGDRLPSPSSSKQLAQGDDGRSRPKVEETLPYPIPVEDPGGSCSVVTGGTGWSPDMGVENFFLSQCREWRLRNKTELVGPQWRLSPAVAPGTFQKYNIPLPSD